MRDAGKTSQVKIIAFDDDDETLAGIRDGVIYGTIVQQPYEYGYQAITLMAKVLSGHRSVIPTSKQVFVETKVIKQSNVEEFQREMNELRMSK
ncbi:MAG TPA: substrate-binding domain-containing protein [Pyrinomonadaceae bacterium]